MPQQLGALHWCLGWSFSRDSSTASWRAIVSILMRWMTMSSKRFAAALAVTLAIVLVGTLVAILPGGPIAPESRARSTAVPGSGTRDSHVIAQMRAEGGVRRVVRLLGEDGAPVAGAVVEPWGLAGSLGVFDGKSGLAIPTEECLLFARADGFLPRLVRCLPGQEPITVVMHRSRTIALTVASSGSPSAGIGVRIRNADDGKSVSRDDLIPPDSSQT
jgi:hypothetical protein